MESEKNITKEGQKSNSAEILSDMPSFEEHLKERAEANKTDIKAVYHDGNTKEDSQIRAGLLTHIQVEPGDSVHDVLAKLNYLAENGRAAFAEFNGDRLDNYQQLKEQKESNAETTEAGERLGDKLERFVASLDKLDKNRDIPAEGKFGMVGVMNGTSPASSFSVKNDADTTMVESELNDLGFSFEKSESPDETETIYSFAANEDNVKRAKGVSQEAVDRDEYEGSIFPDFVKTMPESSEQLEDKMSEEQKDFIAEKLDKWVALEKTSEALDNDKLITIFHALPDKETKEAFLDTMIGLYSASGLEKFTEKMDDKFDQTDKELKKETLADGARDKRSILGILRSRLMEPVREGATERMNTLLEQLRNGGFITVQDREFLVRHMARGGRSNAWLDILASEVRADDISELPSKTVEYLQDYPWEIPSWPLHVAWTFVSDSLPVRRMRIRSMLNKLSILNEMALEREIQNIYDQDKNVPWGGAFNEKSNSKNLDIEQNNQAIAELSEYLDQEAKKLA